MTCKTSTERPLDQAIVWRETAKDLPAQDQVILAQFPDGSREVCIVDVLDEHGEINLTPGDVPDSIERLRVSGYSRVEPFDCPPDWWAPLADDDSDLCCDELAATVERRVAFAPNYASLTEEQTIVTVVAGESGYRITDLRAPDLERAEAVCDRLNAVIGVTPEQAHKLVAASMGGDAEGA